jgi:type I restriction enzyme S subunit
MYGATVGKVAILGIEATTNQAVCACTCFNGVFNRYLFLLLKALKQQFISESAGAAQPNFSKDKIIRTVAPLPPLAEQYRIVAKVEELLALCDELEARQTAAREHRTHLVRSALDHLTAGARPSPGAATPARETTPDSLGDSQPDHAAFVLREFSSLTATPEDVPALRQAILSLAVQGRLVPQCAKDESGEKLLSKIRSTKLRLAKAASRKEPKDWPAVAMDDLKFSVPENWVMTRMGNLALDIEAGFSPQCEGRPRNHGEWGVLKISAVSWDEFDPDENKALPANIEPRLEYEVQDGDFIMSRANTAELVAKSVVAKNPPAKLLLNDKTLRIIFTENTNKRFINMVNNSSLSRDYYAKAASGTSSSMKNINREGVSMLPIALPPLAEQHRIVAKVDELMRWCDELEARLTAAQTTAAALLDASLHEILAA